jgi:hypothetical protein
MSTPDNSLDPYGEILRIIPREPQVDMLLDLTVEESNAVQWANAYYFQLKSAVETVEPVESGESILSLCEQIQKLIPVIHPDNPTDEFNKIYGNDPEMCRSYNYFNQKIEEMLEGDLTRANTIETSVDTELDGVSGAVSGAISDTRVPEVSTHRLDSLALKMFESENILLDPLALELFESEKTRLDKLALSQFESENTLLDQLALERYRTP